MAATAAISNALIPVGEYLGSVYRPDVDYVDGVLERRNVGEFDHSDIQYAVRALLETLRDKGFRSTQETRVQTSATRFRVPDACLMPHGWQKTQIIREAPLLCVEVLSPRDNLMRMRLRCNDYLTMGVSEVWIFDPQHRVAYVLTSNGMTEHSKGVLHLRAAAFDLDIEELFSKLDR
jgi:Uma2 family endonuclease